LGDTPKNKFNFSKEIAQFFKAIYDGLSEISKANKVVSDRERKTFVDKLGIAGSEYRSNIYEEGFSGEKHEIEIGIIIEFCDLCLSIIDSTIDENKRKDGLFHSYNILHISETEIKVTHLYEMLEGQVAALSSGHLSALESIGLLTALKKSKLYRKDQNSYILYPNKKLSLFIEKNNINIELLNKSKLLLTMLSEGNREIIYRDINGGVHFQSDIINSEELKKKLECLDDPKLKKYAVEELSIITDIYEKTFCHSEFTGRANTFYKYEGLGSIYWHMVSKLLLAVQEVYLDTEKKSAKKKELNRLKEFYYDIKRGIGVEKQPDLYGAFPTDPYSHTPSFAGAQQPGMTGQVKEDIISRFRELGIQIKSGKIFIHPTLLTKKEFLEKEEIFTYYDLAGNDQSINCKKNSFAITYCQVPFIYKLSDIKQINVHKINGEVIEINGLEIPEELSQSIFNRKGEIKKVEIFFDHKFLS
jgi:hypothetical protein